MRFRNTITIFTLLSVIIAISSYAFAQSTTVADFLNLKQSNPQFFKAYSQVNIEEAWNAANNSDVTLKPVKIGIIDSGVDVSHPEFEDVNFGNTPFSARFDHDPTGHGTQITGIIGANNILGNGGSLDSGSPQMNGIVSGVQDLEYTIEHRYDGGPNVFKVLFNISELALDEDVDVVNLSTVFSFSNCNPILTNFAEGIFSAELASFPNVLFVTASGETTNTVTNAECFLPGALGNNLDNVINVGGLDDDGENRWPNSPFGDAINIAAPAVSVYAPRPSLTGEPEGQYDEFFGGTSASAPMVTGLAAVLKAIGSNIAP